MNGASQQTPNTNAVESEPFLTFEEPRREDIITTSTTPAQLDLDKPLPTIQFSSFSNATTPPGPSPVGSSFTRPAEPRRQSSLSRPRSPGEPKTPRTANRVRFDIEPQVASETNRPLPSPARSAHRAANGNIMQGNGAQRNDMPTDSNAKSNGIVAAIKNPLRLAVRTDGPAAPRYSPNPVRTWVDDEDYLEGEEAPNTTQRERLLEGMEAGSISAAIEMDEMDKMYAQVGDADGTERSRAKSGLRSAFMNMANSIIGAGIIGQPYAFKQAGLLAGTVLLIGLTVVVDWTIRLIVINSKLSGANSFQATVEHCFGKAGLIAISLAQWIFAFGGMVAFCVIVGDTIPHVFTAIFPKLGQTPVLSLLADRRFVIVLFILGISYPLSLYRDIAKLAKASTLALISMLIIIVTVVTQGARVDASLKGDIKGSLLIEGGIFQAIGVISFAFVCHHNSLLIYGSLKKPTMDRFAKVTHYSTGISMIACLIMALAGFLTFGDKTLGNVLNNFPEDNVMVNVARFCFGLNMLTTLPLETFVCREVMENYFFPTAQHSTKRHVIITTGLVCSAVFISLLTCDLGAVFELIGATSACALAYILPPLCFIKLSTRSWKTSLAWAVVAFGVAVMLISSGMSVIKLVSGGSEVKQCH